MASANVNCRRTETEISEADDSEKVRHLSMTLQILRRLKKRLLMIKLE